MYITTYNLPLHLHVFHRLKDTSLLSAPHHGDERLFVPVSVLSFVRDYWPFLVSEGTSRQCLYHNDAAAASLKRRPAYIMQVNAFATKARAARQTLKSDLNLSRRVRFHLCSARIFLEFLSHLLCTVSTTDA
jgi:hypothetical protein